MGALEAHDPRVLRRYEGLIFTTARRYARFSDEPIEDIQQILRVKVYKAILTFDPAKVRSLVTAADAKGRTPLDKYVYQCVKNQAKDLLKKKPRNEAFIEDIAPPTEQFETPSQSSRDWFEAATGMASTHDDVYGAIEDDDLVVPNTLTRLEKRIICLLYADYRQSEVARSLGLEKRDMERAMRSIRAKMEDWRPSEAVVVVVVSDRSGAPVAVADRLAAAA